MHHFLFPLMNFNSNNGHMYYHLHLTDFVFISCNVLHKSWNEIKKNRWRLFAIFNSSLFMFNVHTFTVFSSPLIDASIITSSCQLVTWWSVLTMTAARYTCPVWYILSIRASWNSWFLISLVNTIKKLQIRKRVTEKRNVRKHCQQLIEWFWNFDWKDITYPVTEKSEPTSTTTVICFSTCTFSLTFCSWHLSN